jgi:hypothetical protein
MDDNGMNFGGGQSFLGGTIGGIVGAAIGIALVIGMWKLFTKAGRPGFYAIIPILNLKTLVDVTGLPSSWFWYMLIGLVLSPISFGLTSIISLYAAFVIVRQLRRVFGKSDSLGAVLLTMIFVEIMLPYIGLSNDVYLGPQSTDDVRVLPWFK